MELVNATPFSAERLALVDGDGLETLLVLVKASFSFASRSQLSVADQQAPINLVDQYTGDPASSSITEVADTALEKPSVDFLLRGCVYPRNREGTEGVVGFQWGKHRKVVQAFGDRKWEKGLMRLRPTPPARFECIPLVWDRSYGGIDNTVGDRKSTCWANPAGVGYRAKGSKLQMAGTDLPNFEDPRQRVTRVNSRPPPVGFGPVAPHWLPRCRLAGTYDDTWMEGRMPLLPADFNPRFHQVAPADQIFSRLPKAGEKIVVAGMRPDGACSIVLPQVDLRVVVRILREKIELRCVCDTLEINMEEQVMSLTWRAKVSVQGRLDGLHWIKVEAPNFRPGTTT